MPLTEDEKRRLLELIDRGEDLTPEEADELLNLAKKFYNEYAGKVQDAWKMLYYAAAIHGIVHGRYERKATPPKPKPLTQPSTLLQNPLIEPMLKALVGTRYHHAVSSSIAN